MSSSLGSISHRGKSSNSETGGGATEEEDDEVPEEIEVEIEEVISAAEASQSNSSHPVPVHELAKKKLHAADDDGDKKKRQQRSLFNLDESTVGSGMNPSNYDSDDLLAGGNLAAHFHPESEPSDSLDQLLNDLRVEDSAAAAEDRDESPPSEVILLNDQIVSIHSLKERQDHQNQQQQNTDPGTTTNCSTTNDISEIIPDDSSQLQNASKSLPKYSEDTEHEEDEVEDDEEEVVTPTVVPSYSFEPEEPEISTTTRESPVIEVKNLSLSAASSENATIVTLVKPMERCLDFGKEILEDISEESEQAMESLKVDQLRVYSITKPHAVLLKTFSDASFFDPKVSQAQTARESLTSGQEQAEPVAFNSLDGNKFDKSQLDATEILLKDAQSKESLSMVTNTSATEYRVLQDEYLSRVYNIRGEIAERDELIEKLTESLQESLNERDHLQEKGQEMADELKQLKVQLTEAVDSLRQQQQQKNWRSDDLANQRLSEVSMDLVSDLDDEEYDRECTKRRVAKQQLESGAPGDDFTKQIDEFQKYLNAEELRIFLMVQKKFEAYLEENLDKVRLKHDGELKLLRDSLETEKQTLESELAQSRNVSTIDTLVAGVREELQGKHAQEMAGLREYFEKKCAELEKQYSEEVFSQSQKHSSLDSESELSGDELPIGGMVISPRSPKKAATNLGAELTKDLDLKGKSVDEMKSIYEDRIRTMNTRYEDQLNMLRGKLRHFERRNADDELMTNASTHEESLQKQEDIQINNNNTSNNPNNELNELSQIIAEYDRRLQEQVTLARQDVLVELEKNIQALLSETATEDSHWPPELILIREKFTAKNQLEITQIQIQHAEEMSRLKQDLERQMSRKLKRHTTFDSNRNLDHVVLERDNLRELSITLRRLLHELAKYCAICETDLNNTLGSELRRHGAFDGQIVGEEQERILNETVQSEDGGNGVANQSTSSTTTTSKRNRFSLDMSCILSLIDDPSLIEYISRPAGVVPELEFNLDEHLEQLNLEAIHILKLSEKLRGQQDDDDEGGQLSVSGGSEKGDDSCEEQEDGLKIRQVMKNGNGQPFRQSSLGGYSPRKNGKKNAKKEDESAARSLPSIKSLHADFSPEEQQKINIHFNELKNRLQKSEDDRRSLEIELSKVRSRNSSLVEELAQTKEILEIRREDVCEGFGANSPVKGLTEASAPRMCFGELQEKAKAMLITSGGSALPGEGVVINSSSAQLLQFIEEFCREGDRVVDENKRDKVDLQKQIEAADKQLKSTRQFLEEQAIEREHERDDFSKEIDRLKSELRDKDKGKSSHELLKKEIQSLETQLKEMTLLDSENDLKRQKLEDELKATVDKIFVLREIITGLEKQSEESMERETALQSRIDELEELVKVHTQATENLHEESLQMEMDGKGFQTRIIELEDKLQSLKPSAEQSMLFDQLSEQLKEMETLLETKTKALESLHADICSQSCSSPSEDVSVKHLGAGDNNTPVEDVSPRSNPSTYTVDRMQRVLDKLQKHTQVEQAAIKRMKDLEMQMGTLRASNLDLQHEKDMLQERMSEHLLRISTLQSRLDEQRHRVEEMHRQGTTDLTLRVHDLQVELTNAQEMLATKEKQITTLRGHLEQSKVIIARQEEVIAEGGDAREPNEVIEGLELELQDKCQEMGRLREKIKNEMVNKMALPDLMETIMAEKNEEIDALKEAVEKRDQFLEIYQNLDMNDDQIERVKRQVRDLEQQHQQGQDGQDVKLSARTLSDVVSISDYDVPDVMRRAESRHVMAEGLTLNPQLTFDFLRSSTKCTPGMERIDSAVEANMLTITPEPIPRHINFSLIDETKENSTRNLGDEMERLKMELKQRLQENARLQTELGQKAELMVGLRAEAETVKSKMNQYETLQRELREKNDELDGVKDKVREFEEEVKQLKNNVDSKSLVRSRADVDSIQDLEQIGMLEEEVEALKRLLTIKDDQLAKLEKETLSYARVEKNYEMEMSQLRKDLIGKSLALEKCKLDLDESINNVLKLHLQLERLKEKYETNERQLVLDDDLVEKVEEELNYSARLDSSILKAMESDDVGEEEQHPRSAKSVQGLIEQADHLDDELRELRESLNREASRNEELLSQNRELTEQLVEFRQKYETERSNCVRMQMILESEKKSSLTLQQQDAELLDQMRVRLEEAMENEARLQRVVEDERVKVDRLSNVLQRSKSRESLIKSPTESSPRRAGPNDPEVLRLTSELRLATSQNERERERVKDLHKTLERERERFEKEVLEQKVFCEKLAQDLKQAVEESSKLQDEVDTVQDKLAMAHSEIDSLEARISNYEDVEAKGTSTRQRMEATQQSLELQDLRMRLHGAEKERDLLQDQVVQLRQDIERCTYREIELTRALAAEDRDQEQVVAQLNEMKSRMQEALEQLAQERRLNQVDRSQVACKEELEERANHLFGKYLRVESFRKALVHQKRYLLIVLSAYQESEQKTMAMLKGSATIKKTQQKERTKRLFKSAVLAVIAIQRMKFIVQRWQSGKRIGAKAIFSSHLAPRRSASASTNVWVGQFGGTGALGGGPSSRDRNHFTATVSTQQQMLGHSTPQLLPSLKEHTSSPFHKYYRH